MAYALKYYAEFRNEAGHDYRLEILQRDYSGTSKKIAFLAGCVLEIQGAQDDITAPIVKTQLRFTVIDASDMTDTAYVKYGDFSEFFTPDETLYKVSIARVVSDVATIFWTGYITPDSWQEGLDYRAPLTFTARDNLGHLQDFTFDMTPDAQGLVCIRDLITAAKNKVAFPMTLSFNDGGTNDANHYEYDEISPLDAHINASLFEGEDWYSVLEETLEGIGYTLRYIDDNTFCVAPLRNMPYFGGDEPTTPAALEFYGGTREYDPAVKSIQEEVDYDFSEVSRPGVKKGLLFNGDYQNYTYQYGSGTGTGRSDRIVNAGPGWQTGYGFLNAEGYYLTAKLRNQEGTDAGTKYPMLIANQQTPTTVQQYKTAVYSAGLSLHLVFAGPLERKAALELGISKSYLASLKLRVIYQYGTTLEYWNGDDWTPTLHTLELTPASEIKAQYEVDIPLGESDLGVGGFLVVQFVDIHFSGADAPEMGIYARVSDISFTLNSSMLKSNRLTTINNDDYNVAVTRKPRFSALSIDVPIVSTQSYKNALYYYDSGGQYHPYGYLGHWYGASAQVPFPAMIHQQILAYRYGAAQVLSGNCGLADHGALGFQTAFSYKGHKFLMKGGTFDMFTGRLASAVFHEFLYFDELWSDETAPATTGTTAYNDGGYGSSGSSASGSGGGGGGGAVVAWGSESNNTVPLSVNGVSKELLKSGWSELPAVTGGDNGKVLKVVSGVWAKGDDDGYVKPSGGIPSSDMAAAVQTSLGKADSALQSVPSDYKKVVLCASEAAYQAIANKDSDTLYLIPET